MVWETGVQSQVKSYQRPKKWYLMPPSLTLSIIRYRPRVKWSNAGNGAALSLTPRCSSYWKGYPRLRSPTLLTLYLCVHGFAIKIDEERGVKSYLHVCVCVCARAWNQYCIVVEYVPVRSASMCLHVVDYVEVYEKLNWLKDGKHANFNTAMNMFFCLFFFFFFFAGCELSHTQLCVWICAWQISERAENVGGCNREWERELLLKEWNK